jgi:Predicted membrane-associated HD superfamily hydrolase
MFLSWSKFDNSHIPKHDAINDIGGVSAIWDRSLKGEPSIDYLTVADINFTFSDYNYHNYHALLNNKISYNVITGYLRDYSMPYFNSQIKAIRNNLQKNGAVFCVSYFVLFSAGGFSPLSVGVSSVVFLFALLGSSWLGVVFMPFFSLAFGFWLGVVFSFLFFFAFFSGGCLFFVGSGFFLSFVPVLLASILCDVCVHSALFAGTAALVCALSGFPPLFLVVAGLPYYGLFGLGRDKVIFTCVIVIINAFCFYYHCPPRRPSFGKWS